MSKRRKRHQQSTAVTSQLPPATTSALQQAPTATPSRRDQMTFFVVVGVMLLTVVGLITASEFGVWPFERPDDSKNHRRHEKEDDRSAMSDQLAKRMAAMPRPKPWIIDPWKPVGAQDELVDEFVKLVNKGEAASEKLVALQEDKVFSEAESDQQIAGLFLREKGIKITDIWKGEPDQDGKPRPSAGHYMLVATGSLKGTQMQIREKSGKVVPMSSSLFNPVIVVTVKDNKIQPLRAISNSRP